MSNWNYISLGEIAEDITVGFVGPMATEYIEEGIPFLRSQNVTPFLIDIKDIKFISPEFHQRLKKSALKPDDVVIVRTGKPGASAVIPKSLPVANCSDLVIVRCGKRLNPNFTSYFINSVNKSHVQAHIVGAVQQHFNVGSAKQIQFPNIEIEEQIQIADVLVSLDEKINLLHRQNRTLEQIAETLFRQWFVEEVEPSWERTTIGEKLVTVLGGTPSTTKSEYWDGDIPWINSGEVNRFRIDSPSRYITRLGLEKSNTKLLPKGTTVIAITGATLGQISLLEIDSCANQSVVGIIPNDILQKEFVFFWIKYMLPDIILNETGGAQPHINKNDVNEAELILPPKQLLNEKNPFLSDYFNKISNNIIQIKTLTQLRDTLLPKLMSGEVKISFNEIATV